MKEGRLVGTAWVSVSVVWLLDLCTVMYDVDVRVK